MKENESVNEREQERERVCVARKSHPTTDLIGQCNVVCGRESMAGTPCMHLDLTAHKTPLLYLSLSLSLSCVCERECVCECECV